MTNPSDDILDVLEASARGSQESFDQLFVQLYGELRHIAAGILRGERPDHTLQPTALVHEVYFKLVGQRRVDWKNRAHFLAVAAQAMRRILTDHARARKAGKRLKDVVRVPLDEVLAEAEQRDVDLIVLDEALVRLEALDPRLCRVVELRFFGGLTIAEASEVLGVSAATVNRDCVTASTWLRREFEARAS